MQRSSDTSNENLKIDFTCKGPPFDVLYHTCNSPPQVLVHEGGIKFLNKMHVPFSLFRTSLKKARVVFTGGKRLKYHHLLQKPLVNDTLFKKLMSTLQAVCSGWSHSLSHKISSDRPLKENFPWEHYKTLLKESTTRRALQ